MIKDTSASIVHYRLFPGEHFATGEDCVIGTVSGSCLVVCLYDPEKKIGGMGHFIVPGKIQPGGATYDEAWARGIAEMEFLFGEMVKLGGDRRRIRASVYGAAMISAPGDPDYDDIIVGNMRFLREYFSLEGVPVVSDGLGGITRRRIRFYTSNGNIVSDAVPEEEAYADFPEKEHEYIYKSLRGKSAYGKVIFFDSAAYETLISLIPDIIYRIDHNGNFTYLSDSIFKLGYEPADLIGRHFGVLVHPDDLESVRRSIAVPRLAGESTTPENTPKLFDERRTGKRITRELKVRLVPGGKTGENKYALGEVISTGHYDIKAGGKKYIGTIGIIRDISEVLSARRALEQTERFYKSILNGSTDIFLMLTMEGIILFANDSVKNITGYTADELIGENELEFTHEEDRPQFSGILDEPENTFFGSLMEHRFRHSDGHWIVFESTVYRILDEEHMPILLVFHSRDITRRKQAEEQLHSALKEKELLLKEIHHRVKNNMQIIVSLLNLQAGRVEDETVIRHLRESQNRIRAIALIHDKLYRSDDLSRINFDLYLRTITDELFTVFGVDRERIAIEVNESVIRLPIDRAIPCGLLVNEIVTNSLKHAFPAEYPGRGIIRISIEENPDGLVTLRVSDNGIGIPAGLNPKTEKTLGLLLIDILVKEQLRGGFSVESRQGTHYVVTFMNG